MKQRNNDFHTWYLPAFAAASPRADLNELPLLVIVSYFNLANLVPASTAPCTANWWLLGL